MDWLLSKNEIDIIETHEAEITGDENTNDFIVSFPDEQGEFIEAAIEKKMFKEFPYCLSVGVKFYIVVYRKNNEQTGSVWPLVNYWNEDLD